MVEVSCRRARWRRRCRRWLLLSLSIGTRKDAANAKRMFRRAIASRDISRYGRKEAMYHLAVQYIHEEKRRLAFPLLKRATGDKDFPEAASILNQLNTLSYYVILSL